MSVEDKARHTGDAALIALQVEVDNLKDGLREHIRLQEIQFKELTNSIDSIVEALRNRLPLWATVVGAILLTSLGYLYKG